MRAFTKTIPMILIGLAVGCPPAAAEVDPFPATSVSGFADILWTLDKQEGQAPFGLGQAEIDVASDLSSWVTVEMALAHDPDGGAFGLGAMVCELRLLGDPETHRRGHDGITNAGLAIGQFDVPIGIDWLFYPSIDRQGILAPLVTENLHEGWNDLGLSGFLEAGRINAVVYAVNGDGLGGAVPDDVAEEGTDGAYGARVGFSPASGWEIGASAAAVTDDRGDISRVLIGGDCQGTLGPVHLTTEYLTQEVGRTLEESWRHEGFYAQAIWYHSGAFLGGRWGAFLPDGPEGMALRRAAGLAGLVLGPGCELRIEYSDGLRNLDDSLVVQTVVAF